MGYDVTTVELPEQPTAVVRGTVPTEGIAAFLGRSFGEIMAVVGPAGLQPAGPAFARYTAGGASGWQVEAGFVLPRPLDGARGNVEPCSLPGGTAARTLHVGDYGGVGSAYEAIGAWLPEHELEASGPPWECYLDGPEVAQPRTEVYQPCQPA
ncbi:MAG TPA: GyrI-like domain-containing protein [Actinomycetales bacterium]|nr:GyrI-like domain-containing protein [Actinomycetales bacterium]